MKYCPKCGSEMDDDLELCPKCSAESEQPVPEDPAQEAAAAVDAAEVSAPEQTEKPPVSAPEAAECEYSETTVEPTKKNTQKIILIAAAALLVIGAVVACILIFGKTDPETAVKDAYAKTCDELDDVFAKAPDLSDAMSIASDIMEKDKMTIGFGIDADIPSYMTAGSSNSQTNVFLSVDMDFDLKNNIANAEVYSSIDVGVTSEFEFLASINEDSMIVQMPKYIDGSYGVAFTDDFADRLLNSYLYNETILSETVPPFAVRMYASTLSGLGAETAASAEDSPDPIAAAYEDLKKTFEYEESDVKIPKCSGLDMYRIRYDKEAYETFVDLIADLCEAGGYSSGIIDFSFTEMPDEMLDTIRNSKVKIYVGIDENDRLAAFSLCLDDSYLTLRLNGKENVWNSFTLYIDKHAALNGGIKSTKNGFELRITAENESAIILACNDKSGKLTLKVIEDGGMNEVKLALNYELIRNKTGVEFELDLSDLLGSDMSLFLSLKPLKGEVTMLDTEFVDVLDFTEEEYQNFMLSLIDGMYGGTISESMGDDFTYENIFGSSDIEYYDDAA